MLQYVCMYAMCSVCVHVYPVRTHRARAHITRVCHVHVYLCVSNMYQYATMLPTRDHPNWFATTTHSHTLATNMYKRVRQLVCATPCGCIQHVPLHCTLLACVCVILTTTRTGHQHVHATRVSCMLLCVCTLSCMLCDTQKIPLFNLPRSDRVFSEYAQSRWSTRTGPTRPYP